MCWKSERLRERRVALCARAMAAIFKSIVPKFPYVFLSRQNYTLERLDVCLQAGVGC